MPKSPDGLTSKQRLFVAAYIKTHNASQAALEAGYSPKTAPRIGSENLQKPLLAQAIAEAERSALATIQGTAEETLRETVNMMMIDPGALFTEDGRLKPMHMLPPEVRRTIASIEVVERPGAVLPDGTREIDRVHKIKFWDKTKALDLMHKHYALAAPERHQHDHRHVIGAMSDQDLEASIIAKVGEKAAIAMGIKIAGSKKKGGSG